MERNERRTTTTVTDSVQVKSTSNCHLVVLSSYSQTSSHLFNRLDQSFQSLRVIPHRHTGATTFGCQSMADSCRGATGPYTFPHWPNHNYTYASDFCKLLLVALQSYQLAIIFAVLLIIQLHCTWYNDRMQVTTLVYVNTSSPMQSQVDMAIKINKCHMRQLL